MGRLILLAIMCVTAMASAGTLRVRELPERVEADRIELRGVGAGAFDPAMWEKGALHWVPDVRSPMLMPREGKFRNIYAPSVVQTPRGWRIFYGGWDGVPTGNDRIYSIDTTDFVSFTGRKTVLEHGEFQHVCNVSTLGADDAENFEMLCTALSGRTGLNKPIYFSGGAKASTPHIATAADLITMRGYDAFAAADINGTNALLREGEQRRMYFCNFRDGGRVYRASSPDGRSYTFESNVLDAAPVVNDVKKFRVGADAWYLMGLHLNGEQLWYTLSRDGLKFPPARTLFAHENEADRHMVAVGFIVAGEQDKADRRVLGVLYGAGAAASLDANRIFARWLQKRVIVAGQEVTAGLGPERGVIVTREAVTGKLQLFAEDGVTALGSSDAVTLQPGRAYALRFEK